MNAWIICWHPRHFNHHISTSQPPSALLSFSPDQFFVLSLWLNIWTWQDCLHILDSFLRLDIPITAHSQLSQGPNHHLHVSTSSQISSLFYLSDEISETGRMLQYFAVTSSTFQLLFIMINAISWSSSPTNAHSSSPRTVHHGLATDHHVGESGKADPPQLHPPASQRQRPGVHWQALARVLPSSS